MRDRPLTIATYAVSASLAALLLGYVFGPTLFPDDEGYGATRKKGIVGLSNPANDCFINSVLQSFVGLKSFRDYLEAECHKHFRNIDQGEAAVEKGEETSLQNSTLVSRALKDEVVTRALRTILNELSETPAYKKTISAGNFVRSLEFAFGAHISRKQQDAQEFLHLVSERLCAEFHASRRASDTEKDNTKDNVKSQPRQLEDSAKEAFAGLRTGSIEPSPNGNAELTGEPAIHNTLHRPEQCFPLEGSMESGIECQTCHFQPTPNKSSFVTLTLNVPQKSSTTLDECLDGLLKAEYIDGYKCDRCRIEHALQLKTRQLAQAQSRSPDEAHSLEEQTVLLKQALADPETPPPAAAAYLPDSKQAPQRRIAKHTRISVYPAVLALHLSRSIFSMSSASMKNYAPVEFPEVLTLGVLQRKSYRLASVVTHRGGHNSGHYETYRRQSATVSAAPRTESDAEDSGEKTVNGSGSSSQVETASLELNGSRDGHGAVAQKANRRKKRSGRDRSDGERWWCISDDKFRACSTEDVLSMQKEAYLLFYEVHE